MALALLQRLAIGSALAVVAAFFIWHLARFFSPPELLITEPAENLLTEAARVRTEGFAGPESRLTINGELVYRDSEMNRFEATLPLGRGENVFVFRVEDRQGRAREMVRRVYRL